MITTRVTIFIILQFLAAATIQAQLAVTMSPPKIVGQKIVVSLAMTNNLADSIESARAICFLMDEQGKMVGQSAKWVIGGDKDRPALPSKFGITYNFVITSSCPLDSTNLTAQVNFSSVMAANRKALNVKQDIKILTEGTRGN
jgi:hypothetical protein